VRHPNKQTINNKNKGIKQYTTNNNDLNLSPKRSL